MVVYTYKGIFGVVSWDIHGFLYTYIGDMRILIYKRGYIVVFRNIYGFYHIKVAIWVGRGMYTVQMLKSGRDMLTPPTTTGIMVNIGVLEVAWPPWPYFP